MEMTVDSLMQRSGVKFGTSGARGLVAEMSDSVCFSYALAFLQYAGEIASASNLQIKRAAFAYDLRESSPRIAHAVARAIEFFGWTPIDCGPLSTPALALFGFTEQIPSIMITGSHIPEDRNGIKFHLPTGEILKKDEEAIRSRMIRLPDDLFDSDGMFRSETAPASLQSDKGAAARGYVDRFVRAFPSHPLTGCRIGLYEQSSVARDLLYELYTSLGASVTRLGRSDTFQSVDTEAVREEDLALVGNWTSGRDLPVGVPVVSDGPPFDAIVSADGDGDRPLLFDEHGKWIRGDAAGILTARFLLADCVVTPVSSSTALELSGWFDKIVRTKIGSPYVVEAMREAVARGFRRVVGYEANGGFLTANPILIDEELSKSPLAALPTRDPAIVHIASILYAKWNGVPLSGMESYLPRRIVMSDRLRNFPPELARQKLEELSVGGEETVRLVFASFGELASVDRTDGIRMTFGDGDIIHLRPSGNAPEFRCYTESDTKERAATLLYRTMSLVDSWRRRSQGGTYPYTQQ